MDKCINALAAAVLLQAAKDYCDAQTSQMKAKIIRELKTPWVRFLSDDFSVVIAEQLQKNEKTIAQRLGIRGGKIQ